MPNILWVDDEIHMLKDTFCSWKEGLLRLVITAVMPSKFEKQPFDAVFLDENMPG